MIEKANKEFNKLKTFNQFKIIKLGSIKRIIDKKTKMFNKLFRDLDRMANSIETMINLDLYNKNEKMNKTDIAIKKEKSKIKSIDEMKTKPKKKIKYNLSFNKKKTAPISTINNNNINSNKFSFITSPLYTNKIHYYKVNPINMKKSKIYINDSNNEKYLFDKKLNHTQKISYKVEESKNNQYNSSNKYKNEENFRKTFLTQKTDTHSQKNNFFEKIKINISNNRNIKTQQSFYKKITKKVLNDYINNSSNILNNHYNKFLEEETNIGSTISNIKYMLEENEKHRSYEKKIKALIEEDIDIPKIRKSMKLFKQSLKGKISFKTNDLFKSSLITKKVADIINYWDNFSKMNDIYFYKNKNTFYKMYPSLSLKATKDPFNKNYAHIYYYLVQKNKIKNNMRNSRRFSA